jgi:DNA processing protein
LSDDQILTLKHPDSARIERIIGWAGGPFRHIISCDCAAYPAWLREIPAAPLLLFVEGNVNLLHEPQIAMVGTRNPTQGGRTAATMLTRELVAAGLVITSGLALGIDITCHQTALQSQGRTVAVLGSGLMRCYPKCHQRIAQEIVQHEGALVSEFWPDEPPKAENFPRRNRIISGLSLGTVVVEAAAKSGSLITARYALEQGREVFAVPGAIHNPVAEGCLHLIQQGAKLVCTAADILEEIANYLPVAGSLPLFTEPQPGDLPTSSLLDNVGYEVTAVDIIARSSGWPIDRVMEELLELELSGWITAVPGGYMRTRRD